MFYSQIELYLFVRSSENIDTQNYKIKLQLCISHYNQSYELFLKDNYSVECVDILLFIIEFDELKIKSM